MKVLISPGFGAGWSTWNSGEIAKTMLMNPRIVEMFECGATKKEVEAKIRNILHLDNKTHICMLGWEDLVVREVTGKFSVDDYDGSESIITTEDLTYDAKEDICLLDQ